MYTLSNLIRDAMRYQGVDSFDVRTASGGSSSTILEDTTLEDKYGTDDLKDGSVLVLRTPSGASPEGEFSRISAYDESLMKATIDALTAPIVAGSSCMIISSEYPIRFLIEFANDALRDCGEVSNIDISTTTVSGQTEYILPAICKRLVGVEIQTSTTAGDFEWQKVNTKRVVPSSGGATTIIEFFDAFDSGNILRFTYNGFHPIVSLYNSPINEAVPSPLIVLMLADKIMQWHGVTNDNKNYANKIISELQMAKAIYPIRRESPKTQFLTWPREES